MAAGRCVLKPVRLALLVLLLASLAEPATAQIYSWRDATGSLVYSDHRPREQGPVQSFKVFGTPFRSTRAAEKRYVNSYDGIIEKHAATYSVSPQLVRAVIQVESGFNPKAVSAKGAMGLMQLMPSTAIEMGVRNPFDPDENIRAGVAYLRQLLNRYPGDLQLALAAYNAGPEKVARYGSRVPPFRETRRYVSQVTTNAAGGGAAPSGSTARRRPAVATAKASPAPRIYKYWERTPDGRLIQKFSDTKPATGSYEIVR